MKFHINIFVVTVLVGWVSCADEFPSNIDRCKLEDEDCIVKAWNKITLLAEKEAVPGLLPISDKHYVDNQELSLGSSVISLKMLFRNVTVLGLAHATYKTVKGFKKDPKQMSGFELTGFVPYMSVKGQYEGGGRLLLLQVTGKGEGEIQYFNTTYTITISTKTEERDGEEYLILTKVRCDYKSERTHFRFENILNNKEISDGINKVANDNSELFSNEIKDTTAKSFSNVYKNILAPIFKRYPYRSFFLDL